MRNKGCPILKWDDMKQEYNFEEILEWEKAQVVYSDTFTGPKGTVKRPDLAHWTLLDSSGFIGFDSITKLEQEHKARGAGAMFLYLYHHTDLDVGVCEQLAQSWALKHVLNAAEWQEIEDRVRDRRRQRAEEVIAQAEKEKKEIAFGKDSRFCRE